MQPWVLPEHYFYPLDAGVADVERPAGVLSVRVVGAEQVRGCRWRLRQRTAAILPTQQLSLVNLCSCVTQATAIC